MTVKMLQAWNGFPKDYIGAVISPAEETRLVNIGFASFDLDGVDNDNVLKPVMSKVNPVTGGSDLSTDVATLKLPAGVTDLTEGFGGGGGGGSAEVISANTPVTVTTTATPASGVFVAFSAATCTELHITNTTGVTLEYQRDGAGGSVFLMPGKGRKITGITNANQIGIRRADYANTPVTTSTSKLTGVAVTSSSVMTGVSIVNHSITSGVVVALPSAACAGAELINATGKALNYTVGLSTNPLVRLEPGASVAVNGLTNLSQVFIVPADAVANLGLVLPLAIEVFASGFRERLQTGNPVTAIDIRATIQLPDQTHPTLFPTPTFTTLPQLARQPKTLRKKGAIPLARFTSKAASVLTRSADWGDATTGATPWGSTALEYVNSGAFNIAVAAAEPALPIGINVTNGSIHLTYNFPDDSVDWTLSNLTYIELDIFSAGSPTAQSANYHTARITSVTQLRSLLAVTKNGVVYSYSVPIGNFTAFGTGADLTAIKYARVTIKSTDSSSIGAKFRPIKIEFVPNVMTKGTVVFCFDGPQDGVVANALPILAKYNYPGVIFLARSANMGVAGRASPRLIQQLHKTHGWQILNHTYNLETTQAMSDEQMLQEHCNYILAMQALGISDTEDCAVGTETITNVRDYNIQAVQRNFRSACLYISPNTTVSPLVIGETLPFGDPYLIRRVSMSGYTPGTFAAMWQAHIDQAIANKGIAVFAAHGEFNSAGEELTALGTIIEYCRTQELAGNLNVSTIAGAIANAY